MGAMQAALGKQVRIPEDSAFIGPGQRSLRQVSPYPALYDRSAKRRHSPGSANILLTRELIVRESSFPR